MPLSRHPLQIHSINLTRPSPPQDSGNKVSRRANITGTANITLGGKTVIMADVHLRGDLTRTKSSTVDPKSASKSQAITSISIGKQTIIATGSVIKPPGRISRGVWTYYPMKIGDNVFIGIYSLS
jgi:dynactin-5